MMHTLAVLVGGGLLPYLADDLCWHTVSLVGHSSKCAVSSQVLGRLVWVKLQQPHRLSEMGGGRGPAKAGLSGWLRTPLRCGSVAVTAARVHTQQPDGPLGLPYMRISGASLHEKHTGQLDSQPPTQPFSHTVNCTAACNWASRADTNHQEPACNNMHAIQAQKHKHLAGRSKHASSGGWAQADAGVSHKQYGSRRNRPSIGGRLQLRASCWRRPLCQIGMLLLELL